MKIAAIYDVHGNLPALDLALAAARREGAELFVFGGDVVPGPMPKECMDAILDIEEPSLYLSGNGELAVLEAAAGQEITTAPAHVHGSIRWCASQLTNEHLAEIQSWSAIQTSAWNGKQVLFCHATPRNATEIFTKLTPDEKLEPLFSQLSADVIVCGHTHMQFQRLVSGKEIVNAGSVGLPFGSKGAYWLLLSDCAGLKCEFYDVEGVSLLIEQSEDPNATAFAAMLREPPSEESVLQTFSQRELV